MWQAVARIEVDKSGCAAYLLIMHTRTKKLIGTVLIVAIALIYALVATTIAATKLADANGWVHLIYFLVTGILWVVPAMYIISWMMKPSKAETAENK